MIRLSKLSDYAVNVLAGLAESEGRLMTASELALHTGMPEPTVSKVLKLLTRHNIINSIRGVHGGYLLERSPDQILVADIIAAIDGPIALTACVEENHSVCDWKNTCAMHGRWNKVNDAIKSALESVTLADMIGNKNNVAEFRQAGE